MTASKAHLNGSEKTESRDKAPALPPRWVLTQYTALVAAVYTNAEGDRESRYTLNTMDLTSKRIVPILLGVGTEPCPHRLCQLIGAMDLAAEQMNEMGMAPRGDDTHLSTSKVQLPLL